MKKHIIVYGLTLSGIQTASSLIESALEATEKVFYLGAYFKVTGDRYLSYDQNGQICTASSPEEAASQPFIQTYLKTKYGITSSFDYAVSRLRSPEKELEHRLQLLQEDETDHVYVSNISAAQEVLINVPLATLLNMSETQMIILDPSDNLDEVARQFFAAHHKKNIWTTAAGEKVKLGKDISFSQSLADKFTSELQNVRKWINKNPKNTHTVASIKLNNPKDFLSSIGFKPEVPELKFQDPFFVDRWKASERSQINHWIKSLQA